MAPAADDGGFGDDEFRSASAVFGKSNGGGRLAPAFGAASSVLAHNATAPGGSSKVPRRRPSMYVARASMITRRGADGKGGAARGVPRYDLGLRR